MPSQFAPTSIYCHLPLHTRYNNNRFLRSHWSYSDPTIIKPVKILNFGKSQEQENYSNWPKIKYHNFLMRLKLFRFGSLYDDDVIVFLQKTYHIDGTIQKSGTQCVCKKNSRNENKTVFFFSKKKLFRIFVLGKLYGFPFIFCVQTLRIPNFPQMKNSKVFRTQENCKCVPICTYLGFFINNSILVFQPILKLDPM